MSLARSYLFVPGTNKDMIKKAIASDADCIILDLEDAVALAEKEKAREALKESLIRFSKEKEIFVRMNDCETSFWEEDLICAVANGAAGVVVPKSESEQNIRLVCQKIREASSDSASNFQVIPLIETAKGVQFAYAIAAADEMISKMAFGSIDFSLDIGCELTASGLELLFARSQIVIASRAAGIEAPIDTVFADFNDVAGFENEAKIAKQVGFKAKLIIHPRQIPITNQLFSPSEQEISNAKSIVKAFEEAEENGVASIAVNNKMVDYPVYKKAKRLLFYSKQEEESSIS
ncbi:HpcH/HpaI aldolase/citrate lyase family protein [Psychrobacillus lasiicapitis]|uniref:CoA ester lyase n=1 Tax=Psychrobacillus lasiicapitis TaxID=1636719 RepID=A0A544T2W4_9BACI|nr:CoA ester lyase [Psychrobacillus lasiicapitis]TQR11787.1 CoA ester lyase [Psychrobacillus lasiicapitis]GGA19405.1 CoA ester lyase [Psychrobacillus lasiicapitis]